MSKHEVCGDEILRHIQEALEFAAAARKFDDNNDIHDACEQYDKSVLYIDEVLIKLSTSTSQYSKLLQLRNAYDERLEFLSSYDGSKLETPQSNRSKDSTYVQRRRTHSAFKEDDRLLHYGSEEKMLHDGNEGQPKSMDKSPYAQMRVIQKSILYGAFLTPSIFIPKSVWSQVGVKFCGLTMKTSAFQAIISIVREINFIIDDRRETVIEVSATTLSSFLSELKIAHDELLVVQNQLSRPFLFIPESAHTDDSKSPSLKGQIVLSRFTNLVTTFGKSVVNFAEVGYQRLGTLATRVSEEDFAAYTALVSHLCDTCQIFEIQQSNIEKEIHSHHMTSKINKINSDEISSASERRESLNSVQFSDDSSESESSTGSVNVRTVHTIIATDIPNAIDSEITAGSLEECYITDEIDVMKTVIKNTNESKINIEDNKDTCHDDNKIYNTTFDNELTTNKIITKVSALPLHTKIEKTKLTPKKDSLENSIFSTPTKSKVQFVNEKSRISILQEILSMLTNISNFMRDVVCEILLRDVEFLTLRHLLKTRKNFSKMQWDEDLGPDDENSGILNY